MYLLLVIYHAVRTCGAIVFTACVSCHFKHHNVLFLSGTSKIGRTIPEVLSLKDIKRGFLFLDVKLRLLKVCSTYRNYVVLFEHRLDVITAQYESFI